MRERQKTKQSLFIFILIVLLMFVFFYNVDHANADTISIVSRLEITTFWTDFVSINWYFKINQSEPDLRMIMIIPENVIDGNLSSGGLFSIDKEFDSSTNTTKFSIIGPLPLGIVSDDFPNDKYKANYYIGCNFLSKNTSVHLGGAIPTSTDNYQAVWRLESLPDFNERLSEIPAFMLSDIGNITSWLKLSLSIFHRSTFSTFVGALVSQVPSVLNILGIVLIVTIFIPICYDTLRTKSRTSKRVTLIEGLVVPISIAVLVFVPIFLLAFHPFQAPLMIIKVQNSILTPLYLYLGILIVAAILRTTVSIPEVNENKRAIQQNNEPEDKHPKTDEKT